jgi:hypothetical protein
MSTELPEGDLGVAAAPADAAGPEFELARVFDFADPVTGPGFEPGHRVITDQAERDRLLGYLRGGAMVMTSTARMADVLDPEQGEVVPMTFRTDGTWIWTDTVVYYLDRHGLAPDPLLAVHIEARCARGDDPGADTDTAIRAGDFLLNQPEDGDQAAVWKVGS